MNRIKLSKQSTPVVAIIVLVVAVVGVKLMFYSHAATPTASNEAESGVLSANASVVSDSSASGGKALQFGSGQTSTGSGSGTTLHYTANIGSGQTLAASLGYNLFDTGTTKSTIDALPSGVQALVWLGNMDNAPLGSACPAPTLSDSAFQSAVTNLASDSKVYGFYISDEPHPSVCPNAASDIQTRADYIHSHAPGKKVFIVVLDGTNACGGTLGCEYAALAPSKTHVDYVGIDPYPCHYASDGVTAVACDNTQITNRVNAAKAGGIPASAIVPTFQTFGQSGRTDGKTVYYRMPTATELTSMLDLWKQLVPNPAFDYSYSFGVQCSSSSCPAPEAVTNTSAIQMLMKAHNQ